MLETIRGHLSNTFLTLSIVILLNNDYFQLLECGGNLFDAVSLAVKAAFWTTQVPLIKCVNLDGNSIEIDVAEDLDVSEKLSEKLSIVNAPVMVTVCKIGDKVIVDPNAAEEQCATGSLVVSASGKKYSTVLQTGMGSLHPSTLVECLKLGYSVAQRLDRALIATLQQISSVQDAGFLK